MSRSGWPYAWADADPPLAYRFTVQVKGALEGESVQLQDFSPLAEYKVRRCRLTLGLHC